MTDNKRMAVFLVATVVAGAIGALGASVYAAREPATGLPGTMPIGIGASPYIEGNRLLWTSPWLRTDGSKFDMATEGSEYRLNWQGNGQSGTIKIPATRNYYDINEFRAGTTFSVQACDTSTPVQCSANSNSVEKAGAMPAAPTLRTEGPAAAGDGSGGTEE